MKCAKCGREVKHLYYVNGIGYGSECFKSVIGMTPEQYADEQKIKRAKQTEEQFLINNPFIYVCLNRDLTTEQYQYLRFNEYDKHYHNFMGFKEIEIEGLQFIKVETRKYFDGFGGNYNNIILINSDICDIIAENSISQWIGEEKEKIQVKVTLNKITGFSTQYGYTYIYIFNDANGNILTWQTSKEMEDWQEGQQMEIKATVKEHTEYKREKQTAIIRCKMI